MQIYVDNARLPFRRMKMSHLFCIPHDEATLDEFAERLGLKTEWRHRDHYDLSETKRQQAIAIGAKAVTAGQGARLRLQQRKKEREERRV